MSFLGKKVTKLVKQKSIYDAIYSTSKIII
jgi:hypothetical protein